MFKDNTTLVLGAGASVPYGFPTGKGLRDEILSLAKAVIDFEGSDPMASHVNNLMSGHLGHSIASPQFKQIDNHRKFYSALIADAHSPTIDTFLRDNQEFSEIGRFYAALTLLKTTYPLSTDERTVTTSSAILGSLSTARENDWYGGLVRALRNGCDDARELESNNRLNIVTFNYDQSLEIYLSKFLGNNSRHRGVEYGKAVNIIHLYGALPTLDLGQKDYGLTNLVQMAYESREEIRIIGERTTDEDISRAVSAISNSQQVVFIGFGFDPTNISILRLPNIFQHQTVRCHVWQGAPFSARRIRDTLSRWIDKGPAVRMGYIGGNLEDMCYVSEIAEEIEAGLLGTF